MPSNYFRGSTPTPVVPVLWDATGNTTNGVSPSNPIPVTTTGAAYTASSVVCSNVATGASAIVAAAASNRKKLVFNNAGTVTIYLNDAAVADANSFPLLAGQAIEFTSEEGTAQLEWRAFSASAGVLGIVSVV